MINMSIPIYDGLVKSPISVLRVTVNGLNVPNVRLAHSQLARLELGAFYETVWMNCEASLTSF